MDLVSYSVNAVLVEGRSVRAVAPAVATLAELQAQIDRFVHIYNEKGPIAPVAVRPWRPGAPSTMPPIEIDGHRLLANTRVRRDRIDKTGAFTLRQGRSRIIL
jgi:hypothetical protein